MKITRFQHVVICALIASAFAAEALPAKSEEAGGPVKLNSVAPDFALADSNGKIVHLSDFKGKKNLVVYFYPKDETPICTKEGCFFRDSYEDFKKDGAEVIGISSDSVQSHKEFAENHKLPFVLLSDEGAKVRKEWGVPAAGPFPGRVTYVIDKHGVVRDVFNAPMKAEEHVKEARRILSTIDQPTKKNN